MSLFRRLFQLVVHEDKFFIMSFLTEIYRVRARHHLSQNLMQSVVIGRFSSSLIYVSLTFSRKELS